MRGLAWTTVVLLGVGAAGFGCDSRGGVGGTGGRAAGSGGSAAGTGGDAGSGGVNGSGGSPAGSGGQIAGTGGAGGMGGSLGMGGANSGANSSGGSSPVLARGEYLVRNVLGCVGCHTPSVNGMPDMTKFLSGVDCFVKDNSMPANCLLSSANLTNDDTGLKSYSDQAIKDAIRKGKNPDPEAEDEYLFARMPYYQYANLSDADADAIVAYLRSVPAVEHEVMQPAGMYATPPTSPEWTTPTLAELPGTMSNGKYLAALACVTCHTTTIAGSPKHIDVAKAFQGGDTVNATVSGTAVMVQPGNLTPDATGIMGWTAAEIAAAIKMGKHKSGAMICGKRTLANMTDADATDIGTYLTEIPAVENAITLKCP